MKPDIQTLVLNAQDGCEKSHAALYDYYYNKICAFYRKSSKLKDGSTIQDLTQTTLVKALCNIAKYHPIAPFGVWLMRIARNELINFTRANKAKKNSLVYADFSFLGDEISASNRSYGLPVDPYKQLETTEKFERIHRAIERMDLKFAQVINMFYFEGKSYDEIAETLCINPGTCKSRIWHAKKALRELLYNI